jgi:hypothetical protein
MAPLFVGKSLAQCDKLVEQLLNVPTSLVVGLNQSSNFARKSIRVRFNRTSLSSCLRMAALSCSRSTFASPWPPAVSPAIGMKVSSFWDNCARQVSTPLSRQLRAHSRGTACPLSPPRTTANASGCRAVAAVRGAERFAREPSALRCNERPLELPLRKPSRHHRHTPVQKAKEFLRRPGPEA